ncbi:MAG: sugar ABC transporter permease [Desulfurococcaceae archaeon]
MYRKHLYPSKIGLILAFSSIFLYFFFNLWPLVFSIAMAFTNAREDNLFVNPGIISNYDNAINCVDYLKKEGFSSDVYRVFKNILINLNNTFNVLNNTIHVINSSYDLTLIGINLYKAYDESYRIQSRVKELNTVLNCSRYGFKTDILIIEQSVLMDLDVISKKISEAVSSYTVLDRDSLLNVTYTTLRLINRSIDYFLRAVKDYDGYLSSVKENLLRERDKLMLKFIGLNNFIELFKDPRFYYSLYKTLLFVATSVPLKVLVGFSLALLYSSNLIIGRKWLRGLMLTPWAIPILLSGLTWNFLFQPNGQLGRLFKLNIYTSEWHAFLVYNLFETWLAYPFIMTVTMGALSSIPRDVIEASYVDGANLWYRVRRVVFPLIARPLAVASILTTGASLQAFLVPLLINYGGPTGTVSVPGLGSRTGNLNELLILFGYNRATIDKEWGYASATYFAIVLIIMVYVAIWFNIYRRSRR